MWIPIMQMVKQSLSCVVVGVRPAGAEGPERWRCVAGRGPRPGLVATSGPGAVFERDLAAHPLEEGD